MKLLLSFILILSLFTSFAQSIGSDYNQQRRNLIITNIASTGVLSGIGAVVNNSINKSKENKIKSFTRGFLYGCLGGTAIYASKLNLKNVYEKENVSYHWGSIALLSLGQTFTENAVENIKPWKKLYFNFFFTRMALDLQQEKPKFKIQFDIFNAAQLVTQLATSKRRLDLSLSLKAGVFIFDSRKEIKINGVQAGGFAKTGNIVIDYNLWNSGVPGSIYHAIGHEMVHTIQYQNFTSLNKYIYYKEDEIKSPILMPYSPLLFKLLYLIEGSYDYGRHYRNFFEFEAEHFSTNKRVIIN